jgi:hypothetical protein
MLPDFHLVDLESSPWSSRAEIALAMAPDRIVMDKSHRLPLPLSAEAYEALGALTAHYSFVELTAAMAVWRLLKSKPSEGLLITSSLALRQRLQLMIDLCQARNIPAKAIGEMGAIRRAFDKGITNRRNDPIHAVWATDDKDKPERAFPISFPRKGGAKTGIRTTAETIEAVTKDVCVQGKKFQQLLASLDLFSKDISFLSKGRTIA